MKRRPGRHVGTLVGETVETGLAVAACIAFPLPYLLPRISPMLRGGLKHALRVVERQASCSTPRTTVRSKSAVTRASGARWAAGGCRTAASAAAVKTREDAAQSPHPTLPPILPDDLPIVSSDDRRVAIGWDTRTWSRLYVHRARREVC